MLILLTGSTGMVGRNILEQTKADSHDWILPKRPDVDLTDREVVYQVMAETKPDMVIHAAGRVGGIQANMAHPVDFFVDNMDMGRNVVMGARAAGVRHLLNIGSSCMYPRNAPNPLKEEAVLTAEPEPTNEGYALAKIATSRLCDYIGQEDADYAYKTIIPCNLYGRWDKFGEHNSHMIPAVIKKLHDAKESRAETVDIWGTGEARREFMYAGDLADAIMTAVSDFDSIPGLMNVGTGEDCSVNAFYDVIAGVVGFNGSFTHDLSKPEGMARKQVDITRQKTWGWEASVDLTQGIKRTYDYYLAHCLMG